MNGKHTKNSINNGQMPRFFGQACAMMAHFHQNFQLLINNLPSFLKTRKTAPALLYASFLYHLRATLMPNISLFYRFPNKIILLVLISTLSLRSLSENGVIQTTSLSTQKLFKNFLRRQTRSTSKIFLKKILVVRK